MTFKEQVNIVKKDRRVVKQMVSLMKLRKYGIANVVENEIIFSLSLN